MRLLCAPTWPALPALRAARWLQGERVRSTGHPEGTGDWGDMWGVDGEQGGGCWVCMTITGTGYLVASERIHMSFHGRNVVRNRLDHRDGDHAH